MEIAKTLLEALKTLSDFVKALVWPAVVLFILLHFDIDIGDFLKTHNIKVGLNGIEIVTAIAETAKSEVQERLKELTSEPRSAQTAQIENFLRNLERELARISISARAAAPSPSPATAATAPAARVTDVQALERKGFEAIVARNYSDAIAAFKSAYDLYPEWHNVDEIRQLLDRRSNTLRSGSEDSWRSLATEVLSKYSWGMPGDLREKLQAQVRG